MSTRKMPTSHSMSPPQDLPEGVPVTYSTTFHKRIGTADGADEVEPELPDDEELRDAKWAVMKSIDGEWSQVGLEKGRPYPWKLRSVYGSGRYRLMPLDRRGQPIEDKEAYELVGNVEAPTATATASAAAPLGGDDMPPWMRLMLAQQAEERAEARRQREEATRKQNEFEAKAQQREWDRQEREDRQRRDDRAAAAEQQRLASERMSQLLSAGMTLAGTVVTAFAQGNTKRGGDVNDQLLGAVLAMNAKPQQQGGGIKDTLDMLLVLDQVADRRAERSAPPPAAEKEDDDSLMKILGGLAPMMAMMAGGGGNAGAALAQVANPQADPRAIAEQFVRGIMSDPDALADIASQDPDATAKVFVAAVQRNPALREAAARAFASANEAEGG